MVVHERELVNNLELNIWYKDFATDNELMLIAQFFIIDVIVITFSIEFICGSICVLVILLIKLSTENDLKISSNIQTKKFQFQI